VPLSILPCTVSDGDGHVLKPIIFQHVEWCTSRQTGSNKSIFFERF
jgi:hypothetical protein